MIIFQVSTLGEKCLDIFYECANHVLHIPLKLFDYFLKNSQYFAAKTFEFKVFVIVHSYPLCLDVILIYNHFHVFYTDYSI